MISRPHNWNEISEGGVGKLPMGVYVAIIRGVMDDPDNKYLSIDYDIVEPSQYKGIAQDTFKAFGRWSYNFRVYYTDKALWKFKKFIRRIERTNNGFSFNWDDPQCLVNKGIGLIIGLRQYYKDGSLKEAPDVQDFCTAAEARTGAIVDEDGKEKPLPEPTVKEPREPIPTAKMEEMPAEEDEGELPF